MSIVAIARPGAVDHAADIAVELDVVELVLAGFELDRVLLVLVAQRLDFGVAEQRVVVERHLGVERQQVAGPGHDQRVDLDQRRVEFGKGAVERRRRTRPARRPARLPRPSPKASRRAWNGDSPAAGSIASRTIFSGARAASSSISMPPSAAAISVIRPVPRSIDSAEIELAGDVAAGLDIDPLDVAPLGAGLVRHQLRGRASRAAAAATSSSERTSLTPPALPRPPAWICALTAQTGAAEPRAPPRPPRRRYRRPPPARHRDAELRQQLLGLIFVDVHRISPESAHLLGDVDQLAHRAQDLSNAAFSSRSSLISTMRSMPPAPITTGTPT